MLHETVTDAVLAAAQADVSRVRTSYVHIFHVLSSCTRKTQKEPSSQEWTGTTIPPGAPGAAVQGEASRLRTTNLTRVCVLKLLLSVACYGRQYARANSVASPSGMQSSVNQFITQWHAIQCQYSGIPGACCCCCCCADRMRSVNAPMCSFEALYGMQSSCVAETVLVRTVSLVRVYVLTLKLSFHLFVWFS